MTRSKWMNHRTGFPAWSTLAVVLLAASVAGAQSEPPPKPAAGKDDAKPERRRTDADITKVIPLQHVAAHELAAVLGQTFRGSVTIAVDDRTNSIIASCDKDALARVEALIKELDVQRAGAAVAARFYNIERATHPGTNTPSIADSLRRLLERDAVVSVIGSILAVRASDADQAKAKEFVEAVTGNSASSAAARGVTVTCCFLQSGRTAAAGEKGDTGKDQGAVPMPDSLKSVVAALAENGFRNAELLTTLTMHANLSGRKFEVQGSLADAAHVVVEGQAQPGAATDTVEIRLSAAIQGGVAPKEPNRGPLFSIESTVTAKLGQFVVLAAAPSRTDRRDSVALVIRVTEAK